MKEDIGKQLNDFNKAAKYYGEKGEDVLIQDIIAKVTKQKQEGKLNDTQLKEFASKVAPFLNQSQRQKLEALLQHLTSQ